MLPKISSALLATGGALMVLKAFARESSGVEKFHWRQAASLLGAFVLFALLIRTAGLLFAAPCVLALAYYAAGGRSFRDLAMVTIGVTTGCALLFKAVLGLPIPLLAISW